MSATDDRGRPDAGVVDGHHHLGVVPGLDPTATAGSVEADRAARIASMDAHGVAQAVVMPSHSYERARGTDDLRALNDSVALLRDLAPDRFPAALGTVDLWVGDGAVHEARRALDDLRLDGLSWHHRLQGVYVDDPRMHPILDLLAERGGVAAVHVFADSTFESPWRLENLAEAHRDVQFVALDAFSGYDRACWMSRLATHHPNLWFDTAATSGAGLLGRFVRDAGSERLLLGTNHYGAQMPDWRPVALDLVLGAPDLSDVDKRNILGDNARRLYGITTSV